MSDSFLSNLLLLANQVAALMAPECFERVAGGDMPSVVHTGPAAQRGVYFPNPWDSVSVGIVRALTGMGCARCTARLVELASSDESILLALAALHRLPSVPPEAKALVFSRLNRRARRDAERTHGTMIGRTRAR